MSVIESRSEKFIVPGERIGVIEEFISGPGTYIKEGTIRSKVVGHVMIDLPNKTASVYPSAWPPTVPREGSVVVGTVTGMQERSASIKIWKVGDRYASGSFTGILHVSTASSEYIENLRDWFKISDIVRAKVTSEKNSVYQLSTVGPRLGVIYASCVRCGRLLIKRQDSLYCSSCNAEDRRKAAKDYGNGVSRNQGI